MLREATFGFALERFQRACATIFLVSDQRPLQLSYDVGGAKSTTVAAFTTYVPTNHRNRRVMHARIIPSFEVILNCSRQQQSAKRPFAENQSFHPRAQMGERAWQARIDRHILPGTGQFLPMN
ncbi:hypothetical protein [Azospirillum aestuarii]|uniref:hypothetical protein n=1 Tax=Azospirillum aestuarii TaxID=2802052 RepID=UPI0040551DED